MTPLGVVDIGGQGGGGCKVENQFQTENGRNCTDPRIIPKTPQ